MLEVVLGNVGGGARICWKWCYEILEVVLGDVGGGARRSWRWC